MDNSFKKNLSDDEKLIYLRALSYVLVSTNIADNEYIVKQAREIGLATKDLRKIKKIDRPESISNELLRIHDLKLRRYFIREMILLAIVDHELSDDEMCNIYKIGTAIGIKEDKINDFFLWAAQGVEWQMEGVRLVEDDI